MKEIDNADKEIELLLSEKEVALSGKKIIIHKISLLDSIRLTSKLSGVVSKVIDNSDLAASAFTKLTFSSDKEAEAGTNAIRIVGMTELLSLIGEDSVDVVGDIISKTTNISDDAIENISAEEGIDLLMDIYEVNKGFFTKFMNKLQKKTSKKRVTKQTK